MTLIFNREQITFNNKTLKLSQFSKLKPKPQNDAKFVQFAFLDLKKVDGHDSDYWNLAIRGNSKETQTRIENQQTSFLNEGFLDSYWPPIVGTDGRPRDGRGRILAAKKNGERFIPVAIYSYNTNSQRNYISNGLLANYHTPAAAAKMEDFIIGGVTLIAENELKNEKCEIENWLYNDVNITKFFNNNSGNITKIINAIQDRASKGGSPLVAVRDRDEWIAWLKKININIDGKKIVLHSVDRPNIYPGRCWVEDILPMCNKEKEKNTVVKIILYTNDYVPESVIKNVKQFEKQLDYFYYSSYNMVNKNISGITIEASDKKPYQIIGAIPQIYGRHDLDSNSLISLTAY